MSKFDDKVKLANDIVAMVKNESNFDVVVDSTGGYIEIDGITVFFDDELNHERTEVSL